MRQSISMKRITGLLATLLTACAQSPRLPPEQGAELITILGMPGYGGVNSYLLAVDSNGRGALSWTTHTRWGRENHSQHFKVTSEALAEFRASLLRFRPQKNRIISYDDPDCGSYITDQPETRVTWRGNGSLAYLQYDYGCDSTKNHELLDALEKSSRIVVPSRLVKFLFH